jgi:hypothetical protein
LAHYWRALRRRLLTPSTAATKLETRGFHEKSQAARELLETIGETFLTGYGHAAEARTPDEAADRLDRLPVQFRGFAYEGAAMGFAVRDALPVGGSGRFARFLDGPGDPHVYMAYVGLGWAMARVPRFRWPKSRAIDPLLRWLVLDGYGFHQAYFRTARYVHEHFQDPRFPWPDGATDAERAYAGRAIDQGIGRALWFVGGTDPDLVATLIDKFPAPRRADLYSGAGLAATYAGGADEDELGVLAGRAGEYRPQLAQGSAFAAEARVRAGLVVPHTHVATKVFCGMSPSEAARITHEVRPDPLDQSVQPVPEGEPPAYEVWRRRIAEKFASFVGGVGT